MITPVHLRLSRRRGFDLQALSHDTNGLAAVNVARPTIFGNPCVCSRPYGCPHHPEFERFAWEDDNGEVDPLRCCVDVYRHYVETGLKGEPSCTGRLWFALQANIGYPHRQKLIAALPRLQGKNLACWCAEAPCHADVAKRSGLPHACSEPWSSIARYWRGRFQPWLAWRLQSSDFPPFVRPALSRLWFPRIPIAWLRKRRVTVGGAGKH